MNERVPLKHLLPYAGMVTPVAVIGLPMVVFVPIYYIEEMGLSAAAVGLLFTLARLWDIITDPPMGLILDRAQSRWGKHKHWILIASPLLAAGGWLIFFPPQGATIVYLGLSLLLLYTSYTLMFMSQLSWGAELAPNYNERIRLFSAREVAAIVSMITVLSIPAILTWLDASEQERFSSIGVYMLVLVAPMMLWALMVLPDKCSSHASHVPWLEGLKLLIVNHNIRRLLTIEIGSAITQGVQGTLFFLMCTHLFHIREQRFLLLLVYFVCSIFGVGIWAYVARVRQKHQAFAIAGVYIIAVQIIFLAVGYGSITGWAGATVALWVVICFAGLAFAAPPILVRSLMSDIIDDDELRCGKRRSGLLFALTTTCSKVGFGFSPLVLVLLAAGFGYDASLTIQSEQTQWGLLLCYAGFPILSYCYILWQLQGYDLTRERHQEIQDSLQQRAAAEQPEAAP